MQDIQLILDFPPTINSYWLSAGSRGRYISKKGRMFRDSVIQEVSNLNAGIRLINKVMVDVILFPPDNRVRDLDNYLKPLLDALVHAEVLTDDRIIDQLFVYRGETIKRGASIVRLSEAGPVIPWADREIDLS